VPFTNNLAAPYYCRPLLFVILKLASGPTSEPSIWRCWREPVVQGLGFDNRGSGVDNLLRSGDPLALAVRLAGRRPAQRTGTDRDDAPARDHDSHRAFFPRHGVLASRSRRADEPLRIELAAAISITNVGRGGAGRRPQLLVPARPITWSSQAKNLANWSQRRTRCPDMQERSR